MSQILNLKAKGLYINSNSLGSVPQGALIEASNIVIDKDDIIESRRGFKFYGDNMGISTTNKAKQLLVYKDVLLRHYSDVLEYDDNITPGTFTKYMQLKWLYAVTKKSITNIATGIGTVTVTSPSHGYSNGTRVLICDTDSTPAIDGLYTISGVTTNTFNISSTVTIAGTTGQVSKGLTSTGTTATFITEKPHGAISGDTVFISGSGISEYNGSFTITRIDDYTFTYTVVAPVSFPSISDPVLEESTAHIDQVDGNNRIRGVESFNSNYYFTSDNGIMKLDDVESFLRPAGGIKALDVQATTSVSPGSFLTDNSSIAYKVVWGYTDANNNLILGTPSQRVIVTTSPGSDEYTVTLTFTVPENVTTSYFYQIYRTKSVTPNTVDPGSDFFLAYESNPTTAELINGEILVTDETPDGFLGAELYTNPRQEGSAQANDAPPFAKDIAIYKNIAFYANTKTRHNKSLSLLGTSGMLTTHQIAPLGIPVGSGLQTITVDSVTGFSNGDSVRIANSDSTPSIDGIYTISAISGNTFKITYPVTVTTAGSSGDVSKSNGVTLTIAGTVYNLGIQELISGAGSPSIEVFSGASPSQNVDDTARSLEKVINKYASNTSIYAYYVSNPEDPPGRMYFQARELDSSAFTIQCSNSTIGVNNFNPSIASAITSDNETLQNRIYYSKQQQFEAVPLLNYYDVGSGNKRILRVLALRDSLIILKEDGIFRTVGETTSSLSTTLIDGSSTIIGSDTAAIGNNQIHVLSDEGIIAISDSGAEIISRNIENEILPLIKNPNMESAAFGLFYHTDRKYILCLPTSASDTYAQKAWVFNSITRAWVSWDISKTCGAIGSFLDKLYWGASDTNRLEVERKSFDRSDFADRDFDRSVTSYDSATKTIVLDSITDLEIGDVLVQTQTHVHPVPAYTPNTYDVEVEGSIVSIDEFQGTAVVNTVYDFQVGALIHYKSYNCAVQWVPVDGGDSSALKQFREATLRFKKSRITTPVLGFFSDLQKGKEEIELIGPGLGNWGMFPWGKVPWGGELSQRGFRTYIPRGKQRCSILNCTFSHKVAREDWQVEGLGLVFEVYSSRINK